MGHHHEADTEKKNTGECCCESKGCHCGENLAVTSEEQEENDLPQILVGAAFFIVGLIASNLIHQPIVAIIFYIIAYVILGGEVLKNAIKGIVHGEVFDENFLMSIATLGAFAIQQYPEAVGVMLFYRVGEWFEDVAVNKSRSQIMEVVDMRPEVVHLIEGEEVSVIAAGAVKVNQLILIRPGERIPLDGEITEGESRIDTSPVTGEPVSVKAVVGSKVLSGCVNTNGLLKMKVSNTLETSMVSKIMESVENATKNKPKMEKFITRFARVYTPFVVILALATAIIPSLLTGEWYHWIYTALTFLVISCPCALVISVPLAFFAAIGAGSKIGVLFKGGLSIEALSKIKTVVMDKTGTITEGNFVVKECVPDKDINGDELLRLCAQAELNSTHPIGISIVTEAKRKGLELIAPLELIEIPGKGLRAKMSQGTILCGNRILLEEHGVNLSQIADKIYGTEVFLAKDGRYIGMIVIADTIKEDAQSTISYLKKKHIKTVMLTGDTKENAEYVGGKLGLDMVYARLFPEEKLSTLQQIRAKNGKVMFVGDGINDAPVLAGADVGAAMGNGADAAVEAADVVFMNSSMEAIAQVIDLSKKTGTIAKENVVLALTVKAFVMILGLIGFVNMWWAVFADTGVAMICILNAIRLLHLKKAND